MKLKTGLLKSAAFAVLITFSAQTLFADAITMPAGRDVAEVRLQTEIDWIPAEIGTVEEIFGNQPSVFLIQDPHGQEQGQRNIEAILKLLHQHTGFKTLLIEGGLGKQDASLLDFFEDEKLNQKAADVLVREAQIGGPELFLRSHRNITAYGLEDLDLYIRNLGLFQKVTAAKAESKAFIQKKLLELKTRAPQVLNSELYRFLKIWLSYEQEESSLPAFLSALEKFAKEKAGLDFSDPRLQAQWPMLVRYAELQRRERLLDKAAVQKDLQKLEEWLKEQKLSFDVEGGRPDGELRGFWESFYETVSGKGFEFRDYPDFFMAEGYKILHAEIDGKTFVEETQRLRMNSALRIG